MKDQFHNNDGNNKKFSEMLGRSKKKAKTYIIPMFNNHNVVPQMT